MRVYETKLSLPVEGWSKMVRMVRVAKYLLSCCWSSSNDLREEVNEESNYLE